MDSAVRAWTLQSYTEDNTERKTETKKFPWNQEDIPGPFVLPCSFCFSGINIPELNWVDLGLAALRAG